MYEKHMGNLKSHNKTLCINLMQIVYELLAFILISYVCNNIDSSTYQTYTIQHLYLLHNTHNIYQIRNHQTMSVLPDIHYLYIQPINNLGSMQVHTIFTNANCVQVFCKPCICSITQLISTKGLFLCMFRYSFIV